MNLTAMMTLILDCSCPADLPDDEGWSNYYVETHCAMWKITARKINGKWEIKEYVSEDC